MKTVPGYGNPKAKIMLIGEAPGAQEIKQGKPFVGPAGKWLDKILQKCKIDRKNLYITNLIKVKLPGNRKPTEKEIKKWMPELMREIKKVNPRMIVLLGDTVTRALLSREIKHVRGKFIRIGSMIHLPTYHPSAARFSKIRKIIEKDLMQLIRK